MDVNAKGVWLGMSAVLPTMIANKRGKICNVASTAAHIGLKNAAAYCASKGAVLALTRQAGVQYAPLNIQINSVSPGTTMTGLQKNVTDEQRAAFLPLTPIGRFAEPEEVAETIVFLCSERFVLHDGRRSQRRRRHGGALSGRRGYGAGSFAMKVLVTGGAGLIGMALRTLWRRGATRSRRSTSRTSAVATRI